MIQKLLSITVGLMVFASTAFAQIELNYTLAKSLVGVTSPRIVGERILVGVDSKPQLVNVAVIKVGCDEDFSIRARKTLYETVDLFPLSDREFMLIGEGKFLVEVSYGKNFKSREVEIGSSPTPGPTPTPTPDPTPGPVTSFRVIFVKESGSTLSSEQTAITGAKSIRDYLALKTTAENKVAGWREYDPQQNITNEQPTMKALWAATKSSITTIPCMVVEVNGKVSILPYPKNATEALETLKKYGGQ